MVGREVGGLAGVAGGRGRGMQRAGGGVVVASRRDEGAGCRVGGAASWWAVEGVFLGMTFGLCCGSIGSRGAGLGGRKACSG